MAERRGHPWAALGVAVLTLGLTGVGGCSAFAVVFGSCFMQDCSVGDWLPGVLFFSIVAAAGLVFGLVRAWKVGTGRAGDPEWDRASERFPAGAGSTRQVAEPGAEATRFIIGETVAGFLAAGTSVTELDRTGSRVRVIGPDGLSGWVDEGRLQPPVQPPGDREGVGDG